MQVREKAEGYGMEFLSDSQILSMVLGCSESRSCKIMEAFDNDLRVLRNSSLDEIKKLPGIGSGLALRLHAAFELGRRAMVVPLLGEKITTALAIQREFGPRLGHLKQEEFWLLLFDVKNRIFKEVFLSRGTLLMAMTSPREVFSHAIKERAASIMILHNHPSQDPTPSEEDKEFTRRLKKAAEILEIRFLDHVIITTDNFYSFLQEGAM